VYFLCYLSCISLFLPINNKQSELADIFYKKKAFFRFSLNFDAYKIMFWSVLRKCDFVKYIFTHFSGNNLIIIFGSVYIEN